MTSPFHWPEQSLTEEDFNAFRPWFAEEVKAVLGCRGVSFLTGRSAERESSAVPRAWREAISKVWTIREPVVGEGLPGPFLPIFQEEEVVSVLVPEGLPSWAAELSIQSLRRLSRDLTRRLAALKVAGLDPLTGLFGNVLFWKMLGMRVAAGAGFSLFVLELYPRIRDAGQAQAYLKRAAGFLDSMVGGDLPVFHVGSGVFAMLVTDSGAWEPQAADLILHRLRRDGMARAHLGIVRFERQSKLTPPQLFDRAWDSVLEARRRGPFSRACHRSPEERRRRPFHPVPAGLLNVYTRLWRRCDCFAVLILACDSGGEQPGLNRAALEFSGRRGMVVVERSDHYVSLFVGGSHELRHREISALLADLADDWEGRVAVGLAEYPCGSFKKAEVPVNARKALRHAGFLALGELVTFNDISLNISGDYYYNDGDLAGAVREYKRGLELNAASVNLLNSLGVAQVQMNRLGAAIGCFERTLELDNENFMALFNLGSAWLARGRLGLAVGYFERALALDDKNYDLTLQLAGVYCQQGKYQEVIDLFGRDWDQELAGRQEWEKAAALRLLGESCWYTGKGGEAMVCLQRASRYNPNDSRVLSLLGLVYGAEGQGDELALSLCRQAVELDGTRWENLFRLAQVEARQGLDSAAVDSLRRSLRLYRGNLDALALLVKLYEGKGKKRLARQAREKLIKMAKKKVIRLDG